MTHPAPQTSGLPARRIAADVLDAVLRRRRALDELLDGRQVGALSERDRALLRNIVATVLRRLGTLRFLLKTLLERGVPAGRVESALLVGAAQILFLDVPDHAAVDLAVRLVQADRRASHYAGLVNAVLRRVAQEGATRLADIDTIALDTPQWLMARWSRRYGPAPARAIALAHRQEPALDLTVNGDAPAAASWAARLDGRLLATGSVRTLARGPISRLPGFAQGAWWVQDAAAAVPARLFGDVTGRAIADLCAAPGGKTAQLVAAGARVTALDRSPARLTRLRENLARVNLAAEIVLADVHEWQGGPFDGVLVDAPCSSTGTIRRHPDIPWTRQEGDLGPLVAQQRRLIERAVAFTRPGGTIVFCTCSLEPEEGEFLIAEVLRGEPRLRRWPIGSVEIGFPEWLTQAGELRTLPCHMPDANPRLAGLDGFYAVRLNRV